MSRSLIALLLLSSCASASSSLGEEYPCEAGIVEAPVEDGYPLLAECRADVCRPLAAWTMADGIIYITCPDESTVSVSWR